MRPGHGTHDRDRVPAGVDQRAAQEGQRLSTRVTALGEGGVGLQADHGLLAGDQILPAYNVRQGSCCARHLVLLAAEGDDRLALARCLRVAEGDRHEVYLTRVDVDQQGASAGLPADHETPHRRVLALRSTNSTFTQLGP